MVNALFVNSGILGQRTFAAFVDRIVTRTDDFNPTQIVLSDDLTLTDRVIRRIACQRLWPERAAVKNLDRYRYRAEINAGYLARRRIRRLERAGARFDVLHFHHQATAYGSLDRMLTTPSIVSIDCTQACVIADATSRLEVASYQPNVRRDGEIFRRARLIVSASQWAANCLRADYPDCQTKILVWPVPVQLDAFDEGWIDERHARARDSVYRPRVLFVGGDFHRKGGYDLLRVWRERAFGARADLDIVTGATIDPSHLTEGVHIHRGVGAYTTAWRDRFRSADLFVLPTRNEAFGIVFQEAAAAGLPSIGPRLNSIPELIEDAATGYLVPPGDAASLGHAIDRLLRTPDERRDFGRRARRIVAERACPLRYRDRLVDAMHELAAAKGHLDAA